MKYKTYNIILHNNISLSTYSYDNCTTTRRNSGFIYQHFHALPPPFRPHSMWALLPSPSPLAFFTNMYFHGTHGPGCGPPSGPLRNLLHPISGECHHVSMVAMSTQHTSIPPKMRPFLFLSYFLRLLSHPLISIAVLLDSSPVKDQEYRVTVALVFPSAIVWHKRRKLDTERWLDNSACIIFAARAAQPSLSMITVDTVCRNKWRRD